MKSSTGCLIGIVLGLALAAVAFAGLTLFDAPSPALLPGAVTPGPTDLTITVSQAYLNQMIRAGMAARGLDWGEISIGLHSPNRAEATTSLSLNVLDTEFSLRPKVTFHFEVNKGTVNIVVDQVDVAGLTLPRDLVDERIGQIRQYAQAEINAELNRVLANSGLRVSAIEVAEGQLIVRLAR